MRKRILIFALVITVVVSILSGSVLAQASTAWDPSMSLPSRVLTVDERGAWIDNYMKSGISPVELEIFRLTNIERVKAGVPPLDININLFRAARFKSQEMNDLGYFGHNSPVYGGFRGILGLFADTGFSLGENLIGST